jgi:hypothetical protein
MQISEELRSAARAESERIILLLDNDCAFDYILCRTFRQAGWSQKSSARLPLKAACDPATI